MRALFLRLSSLAAFAVAAAGTAHAASCGSDSGGFPAWLHAKLGLVVLLLVYHMLCFKFMRDFRAGRNTRSARFYRMFNEAPALLLIGVLILVVVKPF